mmetsp:Transcript_25084/g.37072  ORF Transcript_25084/g.37072 Transcript_25084/m.37072 type:complete len:80 (+) Transcript_25084:1005-1244(+)
MNHGRHSKPLGSFPSRHRQFHENNLDRLLMRPTPWPILLLRRLLRIVVGVIAFPIPLVWNVLGQFHPKLHTIIVRHYCC